jgi:hypothetical protein
MGRQPAEERVARLNRLSEQVFGTPAEVDLAEAGELLRAAGIDPAELKGTLYRRMLERSEEHSSSGRRVPPLLRQALEDLRPSVSNRNTEETTLRRSAELGVARLLREIRELPRLLQAGGAPVFTAAYRNKTELSANDRKLLDGVADDLRAKSRKLEADE